MLPVHYRCLQQRSNSRVSLVEDTREGDRRCVFKRFDSQEALANEMLALEKLERYDRVPKLLDRSETELYLVREHIPGENLYNAIASTTPLDSDRVIVLLEEVLEVLEAIHKQGIVHNNLRLSNLIRDKEDRLYVVGFSQAKPEKSDFSKDMRSLGGIAVYALTGVSPKTLPRKNGSIIWRDRVSVPQKLADVVDTMLLSNGSQGYRRATQALKVVRSLKKSNGAASILSKFWKLEAIALIVGIVSGIGTWMAVPGVQQFFGIGRETAEVAETFLTYENPRYGIRLQYPPDWEVREIEDPITGVVVKFLAPKENESDEFYPAELIVSVEELAEPMSLDEYRDSAIEQIKIFNPEAEILEVREATLANRRAYEVVYVDKQSGDRKMEIFTVKKTKSYSVFHSSQTMNFSTSRSVARKIKDSLAIETEQTDR